MTGMAKVNREACPQGRVSRLASRVLISIDFQSRHSFQLDCEIEINFPRQLDVKSIVSAGLRHAASSNRYASACLLEC